ncbi:selenoprotein S isoform X1 [Rhinopithecus roxellana]|uniref:Selenoprotein S n=1 Tax=Rhinopithecus roxellana TaxID=61622 RepID=A0A2K6QT51_RHIRO|nr:selenoprotein S isoform X1 [Rhinopithecus roxellana]
MERQEDSLSARPALETEGLRFLHVTVGSLLASYGWYIVFSCILLYVVFQKLSARLRALRQRQLDRAAASVEPDVVVKRQEALAAARLKMQEELNAQVEKHKEKLKQLEEEKRRQKIEMWDSMQEGKSYKGNAKKPQEEDSPGPSTSSVVVKRKSDRKPLRGGGYNPLSGEGGGTCSWRPGRRGRIFRGCFLTEGNTVWPCET